MIAAYGRVFCAEILKLRRSLAFWLAIVSPLAIVFLQFVIIMTRGKDMIADDASIWPIMIRQTVSFWCLLMLPLFITLETALLAGLEHNGNNWKHILALPVSRSAVYLSKLLTGTTVVGVAHLAMVGWILVTGGLVRILMPGLGVPAPFPWEMLGICIGTSLISSFLLIGLHLWVAIRWPSFVVAMGFGIVATIAGVILINSEYAGWYPWTMPAVLINGLRNGEYQWALLWCGSIGGLIAGMIGCWDFRRRDVL